MQKTSTLALTLTLVLLCVLVSARPARAGGKENTFGVGAEFGLNGETGGASMNYDAGKFHFGGFLGFSDGGGNNDTDYTFGARFYYHLHDSTMSDFGVGGGIGFFSQDVRNTATERATRLYFEPGVQIRAFLSTNVALSFTAGMSFGLSDADGGRVGSLGNSLNINGNGVSLGGVALAGVHYYFFK